MKTNSNSALYFYQKNKLISVKQEHQFQYLFRTATLPLAVKTLSITTSSALLAADGFDSILRSDTVSKTESYIYTAYGHDPDKYLKTCLLGFHGEIRDNTGAYLLGNGYRAYSPTLMRFHSPDAFSPFDAGGINAYAFALNDPVNGADPSGHIPVKPLLNSHGVTALAKKSMFGKSLFVDAHGKPGAAKVGDKIMNAREFNDFLGKNNINTSDFSKIHLCICDSATPSSPGTSPFAQKIADLSGRPVKGYEGTVFKVKNWYERSATVEFKVFKRDRRQDFPDESIHIADDEPFNYKPKKFKPLSKKITLLRET